MSEDYQDGYPPAFLIRQIGIRKLTYLEKRFKYIIFGLGIYGMKWNYYVYAAGKHHFIDSAYPPLKLGFEADSKKWHPSLEKDMERDARLDTKGWRIYHFASVDIFKKYDEVSDRIISIIQREQIGRKS